MVHNASITSQQCIVTLKLGGVFVVVFMDSNGIVCGPSYLEQKEHFKVEFWGEKSKQK